MLHSWVGMTNNRKANLPFSFSDRGDLWAAGSTATPAAMTEPHHGGGIAQGLIAGTLVATEMGWQPVEDLRNGDRVVTFDNGMCPVKAVRISTLWSAEVNAPRSVWPLLVPKKALGNRTEMRLLPEQSVLIESDEAEALHGDPFLLVSASVLDGYKEITRVPPQREMIVVALEFDRDEVVYANGTTLVHCPKAQQAMVSTAEDLMNSGHSALYQRLTDVQGRHLVETMHQGLVS